VVVVGTMMMGMVVVGSCWGTRVVAVLGAPWVQRMMDVVEGVPCILGPGVEIAKSWIGQALVQVVEIPWVVAVERP